jgi:multisubunit Na+/H+ antiporter MnhF subunit
MAKVTLVFAVLLIALGLVGFIGTGSEHYTALIPTWIGVVLGIFGALALSPDPSRRKLFMHINVTVALLGFLGTVSELIRGTIHAHATGITPKAAAIDSKIALAVLLLIYVILCVRSFIAARRARLV